MNTNKDYINVHPSTVSHGESGSNGKGYIVREWAKNMYIDGFNPQQGDVLVFDNSLGITSQDELASLITNIHIEADDFIVNFGNDVTLTLTDVHPDQISWDNVIVDDPGAADPGAIEPGADEPVAADPDTTDPVVDEPVATDPDTTGPVVDEPVAADPDTTDPVVDEPVAVDPGAIDPVMDEPVATDPDITDPVVDEAVAADPGITDPVVSDPVSVDTGITDPVVDNPVTANPDATDNHGGSRSNGIGHIVREWARDIRIDGFNPDQGDVLVFDDNLGVTSQDELASLITNIHIEADDFIVNFGNDVTLTLTDVHPDQIGWDNVIVGDPDVDDPVAADPDTTDPVMDEPVATDPDTTDPVMDEPVATDPDTTDPVVEEPVAADPGTTDPVADEPVAADPGTTDPVADEPVAADPGTTDPVVDDPVAADPGITEPVVDDPVTADPGTIDPVVDEPVAADPGTTDPVVDNPVTANPGATDNHGGSRSNGIGHIVREWARDIRIDGFNPQQGDVLVFDDSLGVTSQDELASLITNIHIEADDFIVNFGNDVTLTLTDVHPDQIGWDDVIVGDPDVDDPDTTEPVVDDPVAADPDTTDPVVDDPVAGDPSTTDPDVEEDPVAADPDITEPDVEDSIAADPDATDPEVVDPIAADSNQNIVINPGEVILGVEGSENFVFQNLGHFTINNFNATEDMLDFTEYNLSREEIAGHITNVEIEADNFIVNFGDDVSITLVGQSPTWDNVTTVEG
ncbi:MAG: hypothetical protein LV471_04370 [Nitrosomonas sp.]|nr:hypothetical protein [Nitrosomonas sp.]